MINEDFRSESEDKLGFICTMIKCLKLLEILLLDTGPMFLNYRLEK